MSDNYTNFLEQTLKEQINITMAILDRLNETNAELEQKCREIEWWKERADAYRSNSKESQAGTHEICTKCGD